MKKINFIALCFIFLLLHGVTLAKTAEKLELDGPDLDADYRQITERLKKLDRLLPAEIRNHIDHPQPKIKVRITKSQRPLVEEYKIKREKFFIIKPYYELKHALIQTYLEAGKPDNKSALDREAEILAIQLIPEIARLKKVYKSIFMPIVHNMMIDVGVRKRGACKHWAEDLLDFLRKQDRRYFSVTWGQANAEKFTEHNVAVVIPKKTDKFEDGLVIDPWRTSGRPYWVRTTQDPHYHWVPWEYYGMW